MSFYKTGKFRKLQDKWYDKLKKDGFKDIEPTKAGSQDSCYMKSDASVTLRRYKPDVEEYYRRCRIHLNHFDWTGRELDEAIFTWHTEGFSYRRIIKELYLEKDIKRSVFYIFTIINKLKDEMNEECLWHEE